MIKSCLIIYLKVTFADPKLMKLDGSLSLTLVAILNHFAIKVFVDTLLQFIVDVKMQNPHKALYHSLQVSVMMHLCLIQHNY